MFGAQKGLITRFVLVRFTSVFVCCSLLFLLGLLDVGLDDFQDSVEAERDVFGKFQRRGRGTCCGENEGAGVCGVLRKERGHLGGLVRHV